MLINDLYNHEAVNIIDSSKLNDYLDCPRMFFFRHILGWEIDRPNNHLVFGSAWHEAMEHLLLNGYGDDSMMAAYEKFLDYYRESFPAETDELFSPKTPANALLALARYCAEYRSDSFETLYTEIGGRVSIDGKRNIAFKMDSICRDQEGRIFSLEHKTKKNSFSRVWVDDWPLSIQVGTYSHVLNCLYSPEKVKGIFINGVGFLKTDIKFMRVPVYRAPEHCQNWLFHVNYYFDQIENEWEILLESTPDEPIMRAFPQNPRSCTKYFGCAFFDYCNAWANPLSRCEEVPPGMIIRHWNPLAEPVKHEFNV